MRVLVVDDDRSTREVLAEILRDAGHVVRAVADAEAALDELTGVELLVTDLDMPGMGGKALLERLRGSGPSRELPVIVVTAFPGDLPRELRANGTDVLAKPFRLDVFSRYVEAVARRQGAVR